MVLFSFYVLFSQYRPFDNILISNIRLSVAIENSQIAFLFYTICFNENVHDK